MASVIEKTIRSAVTPVLGAVANFNRKRMQAPAGGHPYLKIGRASCRERV